MQVKLNVPEEVIAEYPDDKFINCFVYREYMRIFRRIRSKFRAEAFKGGIEFRDHGKLAKKAYELFSLTECSVDEAILGIIKCGLSEADNYIKKCASTDADNDAAIIKRALYGNISDFFKKPVVSYTAEGNEGIADLPSEYIEQGYHIYLSSFLSESLSKNEIMHGDFGDCIIEKIEKRIYASYESDTLAIIWDVMSEYEKDEDNKFLADKSSLSKSLIESYNRTVKDDVEFAMSVIGKYDLPEKYIKRMRDFFTFRIQTNGLDAMDEKFVQSYYNLLIHSDDSSTVSEFINSIFEALNIPEKKVVFFSSRDLRHIENDYKSDAILEEGAVCGVIDLTKAEDNNYSDDEDDYYDKSFDFKPLARFVRKNPGVLFILITNEYMFSNEIKNNSDIYYRVFGHHIKLESLGLELIYNSCVKKITESGFTTSEDFNPELKKYIFAIYDEADLKNDMFVDDLYNRLSSNYFSKIRKGTVMELTKDCIPRYNSYGKELEDILSELDDLVGLKEVRKKVSRIFYRAVADGTASVKNPLHMVFTGNPGTGKTTVAEKFASILYSIGIVKKKKPVIARASSLLSTHANGSRLNTERLIQSALGGVLFIDEAYTMYDEHYEHGCVDQLVSDLDKYAGEIVVILAGYEKQMKDFFKANIGLKDRFNVSINFEDYSTSELIEIFNRFCLKDGFEIDSSASEAFVSAIESNMARDNFSNARAVRNIYNEAVDSWSEEAFKARKEGKELSKVLYDRHFVGIIPEKKAVTLDNIIGLEKLKTAIKSFEATVSFKKKRENAGLESDKNHLNYHMMFTGNPGTGKTMVADIMADILYKVGVLKNNKVTKLTREDLVGRYLGETESITADVLSEEKGGVIFIDEAYSLVTGEKNRSDYGNRVVEKLISFMTENEKDTVVIFAGYEHEMEQFLSSNAGIRSRIGFTFNFEDYSKDDLVMMFKRKCQDNNFVIKTAALNNVSKVIEYFMPMKNFGNGRFVDRLYEVTYRKRAMRSFDNDIQAKDIPTCKEMLDIMPSFEGRYNPAGLSKASKKRAAIHETGHAVAVCENGIIPELVSVNSRIDSLGRVTLKGFSDDMTEEECMNMLTVFLSGRNAEKLILGSNSAGCAADYQKAKKLADDMVNLYAMGEIGITSPEDFIKKADRKSMDLLRKHRDFIVHISQELIKKGEMSGDEFKNSMNNWHLS